MLLHPRPDEAVLEAVERRLLEELGISCEVSHIDIIIYKADVGDGLTEHELLHVFKGKGDVTTHPNPDEVMAVEWINLDSLSKYLKENPDRYAAWFHIIFPKIKQKLK